MSVFTDSLHRFIGQGPVTRGHRLGVPRFQEGPWAGYTKQGDIA